MDPSFPAEQLLPVVTDYVPDLANDTVLVVPPVVPPPNLAPAPHPRLPPTTTDRTITGPVPHHNKPHHPPPHHAAHHPSAPPTGHGHGHHSHHVPAGPGHGHGGQRNVPGHGGGKPGGGHLVIPEQFRVDLADLGDAKQVVATEADTIRGLVASIKQSMWTVATDWLGPAGAAFAELQLKAAADLDAVTKVFDEMVSRMDVAYTNYQAMERHNVDTMNHSM